MSQFQQLSRSITDPQFLLSTFISIKTTIINEYRNYLSTTSTLDKFKDIIILHIVITFTYKLFINIRGYGLIGYVKILFNQLTKTIFQWFLSLPPIKVKVDKEVNSNIIKLEKSLIRETPGVGNFTSIPNNGLQDDEINELLFKLSDLKHSEWENGKVSGAVYHGGDDIIKIQSDAFKTFCVANQLHPDVFPGVRKMESEVVSMVLKLFNAPQDTGVGTTSSGGTESLLLACLSAKNYGLRYKNITQPEIIIPETAHAGFDKAAFYFGIKLHHVPLDPKTYKVDIKKLKRLINSNTVLLAGSAPNFPHGIIDDIEQIGALGVKYDIPVHVDSCLGSFIVSYMSKAGFNELPPFDFRVPGVTSISCDTHKYGFAPKGSSIIMYRNSKIREAQYYVNVDWVGGIYGSPTLAGSRPGALIVGCWATLLKIGDDGYIKSCKDIVNAARKLKKRIQLEIPELEIIGDPLTSVISFKSSKINIYELTDFLNKKGWHLSALQKPAALHLAVTRLSVPVIDELIQDLKEGVSRLSNSNAEIKSDTAVLYGVAGSVQTTGVVDRLVVGFLDTLYKA